MKREDVWVGAWCAVASGWNSKAPDATRYADICLKEFDERFMPQGCEHKRGLIATDRGMKCVGCERIVDAI